METLIVITSVLVPLGIATYLIGTMLASILRERRRSNVRKVWKNFGLSITFAILFLTSWVAQALAEWRVYVDEQGAHGESHGMAGFVVHFGQSTLENWQSEFLQLFSFVVLAALLIHRGSAESKDSNERMVRMLEKLSADVEELKTELGPKSPGAR
ncbi:MAG: DUF6766 family protein [Actinomycetota bacterium]